MTKRNGFLIKIGILIVFSVLIAGILIVDPEKNETFANNRPYNNYINLENSNLKTFKVSEKIHIDGNSGWDAFKRVGNCLGEGTQTNPYIIENLEIDGKWSDSCIIIENSNVYFKIENCMVYHSAYSHYEAGIKLINVQNAIVRKNNCHRNDIGISLIKSNNNAITGNLVNRSLWRGIVLENSSNNVISLNTVRSNYHEGIDLRYSSHNLIWGNTLSKLDYIAIKLYRSNYNAIAGNNLPGNTGGGIYLEQSNKNIIIGNVAKLFGGNFGEKDCLGNMYFFNFGGLFIPSVFLSLFILAIVIYKNRKKRLILTKSLH